jgi:methionyl aminopeptidase
VPGTTTEDIDRVAASVIASHGAKAAFPGYRGFPKTICVSINEEIVHGIPSPKRKLREGDAVGLDLGAIVDGYFADAARTVPVGTVSKDVAALIETTHAALLAGIEAAKIGAKVGDIGAAIEVFAKKGKYGVVREYVGHGVGTQLHEEPQVPNYGPANRGPVIKKGMTLAIEPMFNLGTAKVRRGSDGWTVSTLDGRTSAHFEHTVVATHAGPVVLGFGRFTADHVVPGAPAYDEYPVADSARGGSLASAAR